MLAVLPPFQQILAPSVVGEVIENPDAVCHCAGIHLAQLVGVVHRRAIVRTFHHLSTKVWPLVQPQLPGVPVDLEKRKQHFSLSHECSNKTNPIFFFLAMYFNVLSSYILYCPARFDIVVECHPLLIVCILPWAENVLEALVVGSLVDHPHAALHPDRVAAAEVCVQIRTVTATVVAAALEFLFLKKCYLCQKPRN